MPTAPRSHLLPRPRGFTLIEMMVGIVIALVGSLVIFQTVIVSDSRSRTTTSGGEAQMTGVLAMYNLERDIRLAGMGFGTAPWQVMGCHPVVTDTRRAGLAFDPLLRLAPVQIIHSDTAPDEIRVFYGNSSFFVDAQPFQAAAATVIRAQRRYGFQTGDLVVMAGAFGTKTGSAPCKLVQITKNDDADEVTLEHGTAQYANFYTNSPQNANFNVAGADAAFDGKPGLLFNLGNGPRVNRWSIAGSRVLQWRDELAVATGTPVDFQVADGVIDLKAQYGVDSDRDGVVDSWTFDDPVDWTTVRAVRVAVLVRSAQSEPGQVTPAAPKWSGGDFGMSNGNGIVDWRTYRYRVYEREIPLRNMVWGTSGIDAAPVGTEAGP